MWLRWTLTAQWPSSYCSLEVEICLPKRVKSSELQPGEILRLFIDHNPFNLIRKIAIRYGSKLIFQYRQNREGAVVIDFKKVRG